MIKKKKARKGFHELEKEKRVKLTRYSDARGKIKSLKGRFETQKDGDSVGGEDNWRTLPVSGIEGERFYPSYPDSLERERKKIQVF